MSSREELEQDLQIVEAELEDAKRRIFDLQTELDVARGANLRVTEAAKAAGVELAIATTPAEAAMVEVEDARKGLADQIQAISELHAPPAQPEKAMSTLDHVRAANAKTDELGKRLAAANTIVNRIAAILGVTSWDVEGTELRDPIQQFMHLGFHLNKKWLAVDRERKKLSAKMTAERGELGGWIRALQWVSEQIYAAKRAGMDDAGIPLSAPEGLVRRDYGDGTTSMVRAALSGDAGDVEVMICRGEDVVRRTVVSALQLSSVEYWPRSIGATIGGDDLSGETPYR